MSNNGEANGKKPRNRIKDLPGANGQPVETYDLPTLAERMNTSHAAGEEASRKSLNHYAETGKCLRLAREECKRQKLSWGKWLKDNAKFSQARVYHYLNLDEFLVTRKTPPSQKMLEEEWRRISGNPPKKDAAGKGGKDAKGKKAKEKDRTGDEKIENDGSSEYVITVSPEDVKEVTEQVRFLRGRWKPKHTSDVFIRAVSQMYELYQRMKEESLLASVLREVYNRRTSDANAPSVPHTT